MLTNVLRRLRSKLGMIHTIDWGSVAAKICPDFGLCRRVGWRRSGRGWRRVVRRQCCGWRPGRWGHLPGPDLPAFSLYGTSRTQWMLFSIDQCSRDQGCLRPVVVIDHHVRDGVHDFLATSPPNWLTASAGALAPFLIRVPLGSTAYAGVRARCAGDDACGRVAVADMGHRHPRTRSVYHNPVIPSSQHQSLM